MTTSTRPSGTVTFVFTDIEGSTRRWEADPQAMRSALAAHDEVLHSAVEGRRGWLFKHTGDGVCAAFSVAGDAIAAAVDAQLRLGLPVRMGIATGEAELRGDDYFGPALNRAARVMAAGHGGQILVAAATAALVSADGLVDLGERRLRDLSGAEHLFHVAGEGLRVEFPPLRTLDATPGNLPLQSTSFVGRQVEVAELCEFVRAHRLVTLTGVGGVGKTRLAVQVAAELAAEFPDGVWMIELAPVGDPASVPDVAATTWGVTAQAGLSVTASVVRALSGRRLLILLDNCEHLLDAAADLVEAVLAGTDSVSVVATSREGLRVGAEQLWPVPSLDVAGRANSAAVSLFAERARSVNPAFELNDDAAITAVVEICERLDGIALAIELAAARMVSMSPAEVRDRLKDRFRLLSGSRRGLERHQTLRHAVGWSFDLLENDERTALERCAVFAGGFDLAAASALNDGLDEYRVLDVLDSLVRKSLVTVEQAGGRTRYGMLETIRQYGEDQLAASGTIAQVRDCHAAYFAMQAVAYGELWDGPDQRVALDWVDAELANLRAGFRWASDGGDLAVAAAIAAHAALLGVGIAQFEAIGWAEELLPAATTAELAQLPRLYTAASLCYCVGRSDDGVAYARTAVNLATDARYDPYPHALSTFWEAMAHMYAGRAEQALAIFTGLAARSGPAHVYGCCGRTHALGVLHRHEEAAAIAEETLAAARAHANPFFVAAALYTHGLAYTRTDPARALDSYQQGLVYAREHHIRVLETVLARQAAHLAALHGDLNRALTLHDEVIDSFHHAGALTDLGLALLSLASTFRRLERPETAATLYGSATQLTTTPGSHLPTQLRAALGDDAFERCTAAGAAMEPAGAARYARHEIQRARHELSW